MPDIPENLAEKFKQSQESLLVSLEQITQHARLYEKARSQLPELENKLLLHLQYQQKTMYPALKAFFCANRAAEKKLEFLQYESNELKVRMADFLDKYSYSPSAVTARNFPIAFMEFRQAVVQRIHSEEDQLLPLLEQFMTRDLS